MFRNINNNIPVEIYNHIFSFLSNRELYHINLICTNSLLVNGSFWKRKLQIEFNTSIPESMNAKEHFVHLYNEKNKLKESVFLTHLLDVYRDKINNFDEYCELMSDKKNIKKILNDIIKLCSIDDKLKIEFSEMFDKILHKLLFSPDFIHERFLISQEIIHFCFNDEMTRLNELKQILINPLTEQAYQRYCDLYYQYPLIAYFLQLGTPYNFVNPSIIDDALTNTTSVLSKKLANNLFFTKMESATLFSIIINAIDLNAIELFKIILKNQPTLVRCSLSWNRCSLLHQACFAHSFEIVDLLLKNKADVNLYQTIRIERAKESREFLIRNILNPSALQFAIFSATLKQDMPQTKKLVDLLLRYQSDPDLEYRDDDFGLISTRKFCQIVLGLPLSPDPEKAKQAMEFNEILTSIVKFYPNKNQSVVLAQDDESRNELPEENRIKFNY